MQPSADIPVSGVHWPRASRIVATRHPPIDLFEDIAEPEDWDAINIGEGATNARLMEAAGQLQLVPAARRVSGPGASQVMAPFTHVSPEWAGRFHTGLFGAYYAANRFETAVAETAYHRARFYRASGERPGWFCQFRELIGEIRCDFADIRDVMRFADYLQPDDYRPSQQLAVTLRDSGSNGVVYPSVRDAGGECIAAFWPDCVGIPITARLLSYHFDGERIDIVRDDSSRQLYRP